MLVRSQRPECMDGAQSPSEEPASRWRRAATECLFFSILLALVFQTSAAQQPADYFKIVVVDQDTGRGVPLVELRTTNDVSHYTNTATQRVLVSIRLSPK